MKVIGITGTNASGKDTAADYLKDKYGFKNYSLSDEIRFEATQRGLPHERENLRLIGNELREKFAPNELAVRATRRITASGDNKVVVTSIRNPAEAEYLKNNFPGFKLIYVDAPVEMRHERSRARGRVGDGVNLDDFRAAEAKELEGGKTGQQLLKCQDMADFEIINDGTLEKLFEKIEKVLSQI
ncbi:MAG TPA: AAA family ATPase [Candidatus Paceibacterota bacterium]|nr:AAA family ATPase [Candidatus Paceibacterota bacterium]